MGTSGGHIVLLGDSVFDNRAYTGSEPDVVSHLSASLSDGWRATLLAVDGSMIPDVAAQVRRVPRDASHLIVSIGGNDALGHQDLLATQVRSTTEALALFGARVSRFESHYRAAVGLVTALGLDTTVCTIYNGNLEEPRASLARVGLMLFNDAILRVAFERRLKIIDLRLVCSDSADYANPIEPSGRGGAKIAQAIAQACGAADGPRTSTVFI